MSAANLSRPRLAATTAAANGRPRHRMQTVLADTPAAGAGVKAGDIILAVDASKATGVSDLVAAIAARRPGDRVTLTVQRGSRRLSLRLTLTSQPDQTASD